jgi:alpha-beta hydrolase superfamily lysophospholipase
VKQINKQTAVRFLAWAILFTFFFCSSTNIVLAEQAINLSDQVVSVEDGPLSNELHLPVCEWYPKNQQPKALLLAVHGLTLHGKRYQVLGRAFALDGFYACAPDMRGFGRCYANKDHKYCVGDDCKQKVDLNKSYADIVQLALKITQLHPGLPLFLMGESLGTSVCIRLAGEHPELVKGLILSGPTVRLHPLMFFHHGVMAAGAVALFIDPWFRVNTNAFVRNLVSNDPNVVAEMLNDPLCRKDLTIDELLKTGKFVIKTLAYARRIKPEESILIVQGSEDRCMVPHAVTRLSKQIESADQTIRWLHAHGHLLLETAYLRPALIDALTIWIDQHETDHIERAKSRYNGLGQIGAMPVGDNL